MKKSLLIILILCPLLLQWYRSAESDKDMQGVKEAVLDYAEAIYEAKPERISRSVDVTLRKYGYWRPDDSKEYRAGSEMNFKQLYSLAERWNVDGAQVDAKTARKEVSVLDMLDKTASAKLVASWGVDYFHLAKEDGKWKIINVIWQSHPPEEMSN